VDRLFGRDPRIVGQTMRIAEVQATATIAGIAPPALDLPLGTDFWFNMRTNPQDVAHNFQTVARMRAGVTVGAMRSASSAAMAGLARTIPSDIGREYVIRPLVSALVGDLGPTLLIVFGATALLLVLACVNVTGLLLARAMARTREITVRTALGASRGRVVRQLLTESLVESTRCGSSDPVDDYFSALSRATCRSGREWPRRTISTTCPSPFAR
jgi:putative ABC transport system permease protein